MAAAVVTGHGLAHLVGDHAAHDPPLRACVGSYRGTQVGSGCDRIATIADAPLVMPSWAPDEQPITIVAMAAPVHQRTLKQRLVTISTGVLDAMERTLSPFTIGGRKRDFAEPPHMHSSMIFVPGDASPVQVGDEVPVTTRMTTVTCDEVRWV